MLKFVHLLTVVAMTSLLIGCETMAPQGPDSSHLLAESEAIGTPRVDMTSLATPESKKELFAITEEYFENTYSKAEGFLRSAKDLYNTGLVREAMPYLDTALLTILDSQIELSEFPRMRELYKSIYDLNAKILSTNPDALDIYLDNRWSHFNTANYTVPIDLNNAVRHFIEEYQTASRGFMERSLKRSGKYLPMILRLLSEHDMPEDLAYLVIIESGFSPQATSYAKARGLWQFMPSTGRRYGLKMNYWVDERCDPEKSTRAAIGYMKDLFEEFKSWKLVLASYNGGEGRVRRAVSQSGTTDFWDIAHSEKLHQQTEEYVPRFMAATIIARYPEKFGFYIDYDDPVEHDVVTLDGWIDLNSAAKCAGTTYSELKSLNPELRRWCTPPIFSKYELKIPRGSSERFWAQYDKLPQNERSRMVWHRIKYGETLSSIARRYGSSVKSIMRANGMSNTRITAGKRLMIPVLPKSSGGAAAPSDSDADWSETITYRVRSGDTLYAIAQRYGSSVTAIKQANGLRSSRIKPGQRLIVPILKSTKKKN